MNIKYRPAAIEDIEAMTAYLAVELHHVRAAQKLRARILHGISLLKENPLMGRQIECDLYHEEAEMRFLIVSRQMVFYEINAENHFIEIIRVLDSRTDYLTILFGENLAE